MSINLYITEKPSVALEFAKALNIKGRRQDGFIESGDNIVTWCVGHLVTMSYPEAYDLAYKKWRMDPLPFLPKQFKYEIIPNVKKQFQIVRGLLNREDVSTIYVCTDSGREGEYIYRLVDQEARVPNTKVKKRVWIDSQTEEEILRGIREAKPLSAYDNLSNAAYLRAKEDYLMGINFSRVLTLKYGNDVQRFLKSEKWSAISVGRVMTCVLGMVVRREREIRNFVKTPFYRVLSSFAIDTQGYTGEFVGEFKAVSGSEYYNSPLLYKENGFLERASAIKLIKDLAKDLPNYNEDGSWVKELSGSEPLMGQITSLEKKKENKNPPLLYNLAELQNDCARMYKISPDETLKITQELYEKKLVTYPRTDARVLSSAVAKEIKKNIDGLQAYTKFRDYASEILASAAYKGLEKTRYVNDSKITDHYAIIPTGQGLAAIDRISVTARRVYETIARRFLSIFYPPAIYRRVNITLQIDKESFFSTFRVLEQEGYFKVAGNPSASKEKKNNNQDNKEMESGLDELAKDDDKDEGDKDTKDQSFIDAVLSLKKGMKLAVNELIIKEGETSPPKRYSSGTLILAMENAGQFIEDEELRAQIKGSGIGTSATRAEILNKLVKISYLSLNKKTQIVTPALLGELVYEVVNASIRSLLNAELTASWEKGLAYVEEGKITTEEYMEKLEGFVGRMVNGVKKVNNQVLLSNNFHHVASYYK
ncbi:MAG: type IA DNA topoisomerase [Clostridiales bacterium]|jgi:DNA topoisomerase-3|nr:DNA topoisomerase [Bacillota bacterium]NLK02885.1 type IA DNA topoisomerase [Clostridiales bacterium]